MSGKRYSDEFKAEAAKQVIDQGRAVREVTSKEYYRYDAHGRRVLAWSPTLGSIFS